MKNPDRFNNFIRCVKEHHDRIKESGREVSSVIVLMVPSYMVKTVLTDPIYLELTNENLVKFEVLCMVKVNDRYPYIDSCNFDSGKDYLIYMETNHE